MVVVYTVPSTKYVVPLNPLLPLDEIEITGPPAQQVPQNSQQTASFTLNVKNVALTTVTVSITLTRFQHITAGAAANLGPAAGPGTPWTFSVNPTNDPYEARWVMQASAPALAVGSAYPFAVQFNTGTTAGTFRITYRVQASQLSATDPTETTFDMVVA
jgi:hypothetical protein